MISDDEFFKKKFFAGYRGGWHFKLGHYFFIEYTSSREDFFKCFRSFVVSYFKFQYKKMIRRIYAFA
jgi:hypothetical protein